MDTIIVAMVIFAVVVFAMIIASLLNGKPMAGSCGGISKMLGLDGCMFCTKKKRGECPTENARTR